MSRSTSFAVLIVCAAAAVGAVPIELECDVAALLATPDPSRRVMLARRLLQHGAEGMAALEALAQHPRANVRAAVAPSLSEESSDGAERVLGSLLYDPELEVAVAAARSLLRPGREASAPTLRAALRSWTAARDELHAALVDGLTQHGGASDRELVRPGLSHGASNVVVASLLFFARHGDVSEAPAMSAHVLREGSEESRVAFAALDRLYRRPDPERLVPLLASPVTGIADYALIALRRFASDDPFVRDVALARLAGFRGELRRLESAAEATLRLDSLRTLHRFLENDFGFWEDESELEPLARRLGTEPDARVRKVLLQILAGVSSRRIWLKPPNVIDELPLASRGLIHLDSDDVVVPALIAALVDEEAENRTFADEVLRQLSGRESTFPFDGVGTREERDAATAAWRAWWEILATTPPTERTRAAVGQAIQDLSASATTSSGVVPGLVYVTGSLPPAGAAPAAVVAHYREWWRRHGSETPSEWLAPIALRPIEDIPLRAWHRMSRLLRQSIELPIMVLPEERRRVAAALRSGTSLAPPARSGRPWLAETAIPPNRLSAATSFAFLAFANGEYNAATTAFGNLVRGDHASALRVYLGASALLSSPADLGAAERQLTEVLAASDQVSPAEGRVAAYFLGRARSVEGRHREAGDLLGRALVVAGRTEGASWEIDPGVAELERAVALFDGGFMADARTSLKVATAVTAEEAECLVASRERPGETGPPQSGLAACDRVLAHRPLSVIPREARALIHEALIHEALAQRSPEAAARSRAAALSDREILAALAGIRESVARGLGEAEARMYASWLVSLFGDSETPEVLGLRGRLALAAGDARRAASDLGCAVAGGDDSAATLIAAGLASEVARNDVGALRAYLRLSRAHPPLASSVRPFRARVTRRLLTALGFAEPGT